ncbi:MAG: arylsulfatase A-like enzyme [Mariniblastus sp.]|jgi:arylsulfatase A-like enzyme
MFSSRLLIASLLMLLGCLPVRLFAQSEPNVIFILADDLGYGDLGVLHQNDSTQSRKFKTPCLDQMAADGITMPAHYCPAPVCAPSRASLLMGVHQGHATVRNNQFDKELNDNHTLATVMKTAGYKTALIGKYGLQGEGNSPGTWPGYPTKRGFDEFYGYVAHRDGHVHYPADAWPIGNSEAHQVGKDLWWNDREVSQDLAKCYTTDLFTARSKHWITEHRQQNPDQPFFLYLAYDTPHGALQVPTGKYPEGQGLKGGVQWLGKPGQMINTATGTIDSYRHPDYTGKNWSDVEERFATMVRRIDNCVGDLLQTLRDLEIEDNTLVVFTSDNGPHHESYLKGVDYEADSFQSFGPFDGTKRDTWEGGIRMPTLAWWPGKIPADSVHERSTQFHDWMPTFAELGGIVAPARTDGVSMLNSLQGKQDAGESTVYVEYFQGGRSKSYESFLTSRQGAKRHEMQVIHLGGFKGIRTDLKSHSDPFEIYDVKNDLGERNNLAGSSAAFVQLQQAMKDQVLRLRVTNDSAKRPYDNELIPGYAEVESSLSMSLEVYRGEFPFVPKLTGRVPDHKLKSAESLDSFSVEWPNQCAMRFVEWIEIKEPGEYLMSFESDTKAFVRMHEASIFDADFGYQPGEKLTRSMRLGKGWHPVTVSVLTGDEGHVSFKFLHQKK